MLFLYKLLIVICFLGLAIAVPIISAGITFGSPLYRPIATPIYYERPYDHYYYPDNHYYDESSTYPYEYSQNYYGGGIGGIYSSTGYSPFIFR